MTCLRLLCILALCFILFEPAHDKTTIIPLHPAKTQISQDFCPVWPVFDVRSLGSWDLKVFSCEPHGCCQGWSKSSLGTRQIVGIVCLFVSCLYVILATAWQNLQNDLCTRRKFVTICMKCKNLSSGENKKNIFQYVVCWKFSPQYLALNSWMYKENFHLSQISHRLTKPIMTCAPSEDSDWPWYPISLDSLYESVATYWGHREDWPDWADAQHDLSLLELQVKLLVLSCACSQQTTMTLRRHRLNYETRNKMRPGNNNFTCAPSENTDQPNPFRVFTVHLK